MNSKDNIQIAIHFLSLCYTPSGYLFHFLSLFLFFPVGHKFVFNI